MRLVWGIRQRILTINPEDYVITRKRKKYKFALFANHALCFEFDEWQPMHADVVELGAGTGLSMVELACMHADKTFVAVDVKADRLIKGAERAEELGLTNVMFLRARADQITECFTKIGDLWITFPDPFPKKRSAGRRLTHKNFLERYRGALEGSLFLKHDDAAFFEWSLEQLVAAGWQIEELNFDLHKSDLADYYKIKTTYEERWLAEGRKTNFVKARRSV